MSTVANGNRGDDEVKDKDDKEDDGEEDKRSELKSINIDIFISVLVDFEGEDIIGRCRAEVEARGSITSRGVTTAICCWIIVVVVV